MNEDQAIKVLEKEGLLAKYSKNKSHIVGGTRCKEEEFFTFYEYKFQIEAGSGGWVVKVPGPGQFETEKVMGSLSEAVEFICKYYADHGWGKKARNKQ